MQVKTVVVGTDGSDNAWKALQAAASLIDDDGVVHVVSAFEPLSSHAATEILSGLPKDFANIYDPFGPVRLLLQDSAAYFANRNIRCETHTSDDDPASAILDVADEVDADLIVVGSRGLGRGKRFIHGSVSSRVATHAKRSYLVVHEPEE